MNKKNIPWIVTTAAILVTAFLISGTNAGGAHVHPEARADYPGLGATVMNPADASNYQRAVRAYRIALTIPNVLDGIHCYCECHENIGHRSLLTCFQSRHGAACDVCIGEAEMAGAMTQRGEDVDGIREAIDAAYGTRVL